MVGYITETTGGDYTPTPEGQHIMVCARVIDLGTQPGSSMYPAPKRKIRIFWELPEHRIEYTDGDGNEKTGPVLHSEQYTVSFHEKANLRKDLEAWRGVPFTEKDFAGPPNGFHLSKLLGIPAVGQVIHEHRDGKTYANLNSIMKPRKAEFDEFKDKIEGERIFFDLDDFKQEEFDKLSDRLKATIQNAPEYQKLFGGQKQEYGDVASGDQAPKGHGYDDMEDTDIPF